MRKNLVKVDMIKSERNCVMKEFYNMTGEEVKLEVNGTTEPLTDEQAAANIQ